MKVEFLATCTNGQRQKDKRDYTTKLVFIEATTKDSWLFQQIVHCELALSKIKMLLSRW